MDPPIYHIPMYQKALLIMKYITITQTSAKFVSTTEMHQKPAKNQENLNKY